MHTQINKKITSLPFYICLTLISISYLVLLALNWNHLDFSFNFDSLTDQYNASQITQGSNAHITMYDPQLYQFAGYTYLTQGKLDQINIEHPPLGKYFYGMSALLFGSPLIIQLVFGFLILICTYLLALHVFQNSYISLIPSLLLLLDKLFLNQISQTELDLPLTTFVLIFLYTSSSAAKPNLASSILNGILLGLAASIKFPAAAVILAVTYSFYMLWKRKSQALKNLTLTMSVALFVYLVMYTPLILSDGISGFIQIQVQALHIHRSHLPDYPALAPIRVIFGNQWPVWFDQQNPYQRVGVWSLLWPISTVGFFISVMLYRKISSKMHFLLYFAVAYFIFINTRLFFPRYLMTLLPITYICLTWVLSYYASLFKSRNKN